jgi:hypothetical protein
MPAVDLELIRLEPGAHPASPDGCLMEWVSVVAGVIKTDRPAWVNHLVTIVAVHLNDALDDVSRQRLKAFIPQLVQARRTPADERIGVRLAIWAATSIGAATPERLRPLQQRAVVAAAGRIDGPVTGAACRAAAVAAAEAGAQHRCVALYAAADAADAASADDPWGGTVNAVSAALHQVLRDGDPLAWFDGFLAAHAAAAAAETGATDRELVCSPA